MASEMDIENATKAAQCAALLVSDVRALAASRDLLLSELGMETLELVVKIEQKLKRIESILTDSV